MSLPPPMVWLAVAILGLLVFGHVLDEVEDHRSGEEIESLAVWDQRIHEWVNPRVPPSLVDAGLFLDRAGSEIPTLLLLGAAGFLLWRHGQRLGAALLTGGAALLEVVVLLTKAVVARPRPEAALLEPFGHSFPSGHAAFGAYVSVMLAWLVLQRVGPKAIDVAVVLAAAAWATLMAASRVILSVHYVSDVVAGAALGVGVAAAALSAPGMAVQMRQALDAARHRI